MKNYKLILTSLLLLCTLTLSMLLTACGAKADETPASLTADFDGVWMCGDAVLALGSGSEMYTFITAGGRVGDGPYRSIDGEPFIEFDSFLYNVVSAGEDTLTLRQNGSGDAESLDGWEFTRVGSVTAFIPDAEDYNGTWISTDGVTMEINMAEHVCNYTSETSVGQGSINDDYDGKGRYIYLDGQRCYMILNESMVLTLEPNALNTGEFIHFGE